jgi:hypothetical protein
MRSFILAVCSVAALLSFSSGAFAQGAEQTPQPITPQSTPQPAAQPIPQVTPSATPGVVPTVVSEPPLSERGRYHPCPASVELANGRNVCLGVYDERRRPRTRHVARRVAGWGWGCRCCW